MSFYTNHMTEDIVAQLLMDLGVGTDPVDDLDWPVFSTQEPDLPDDCITVYGTEGTKQGRNSFSGEVWMNPGVQLRVRSALPEKGGLKCKEIEEAIDGVYDRSVSLDPPTGTGTDVYLVHDVSRQGGAIPLGKESPSSRRNVFTINALVSLRQTQ